MRFLICFLLFSITSYSQCNNVEEKEDKFTKVTTRTTKQGLKLYSSNLSITLTMSNDGSHTISFYISSNNPNKKSDDWEEIIFLFDDGTTQTVEDGAGPIGLNEVVADDAFILNELKTKKVVAIRLYDGKVNYDFDVSSTNQEFFMNSIECLFPPLEDE